MNKLLFFLVIMVYCSFNVEISGQIDVESTEINWLNLTQIKSETKRVKDHDLYQGDLYLYDEWKKARFELPSGDSVSIDSVKLNLLRGYVEMYVDGRHLWIDNKHYNSFVFAEIPSVAYKYKHYFYHKGHRLPGIIRTIDAGEYSVLVSYDTELREISRENPFMLDKMRKDRVRVTKLRYIEKDGELLRIKSKKDFRDFFKSNKRVTKFINSKKLSHKNEDDIAEALVFSQQLQ